MQMERSDISAEMMYNSLSLCEKRRHLLYIWKKKKKKQHKSPTIKHPASLFKIEKKFCAVGHKW